MPNFASQVPADSLEANIRAHIIVWTLVLLIGVPLYLGLVAKFPAHALLITGISGIGVGLLISSTWHDLRNAK